MPRNLYKKAKISSPRLYPLRGMAWFNMASQRCKVQLAPPTGKIFEIQDGHANSEIGYEPIHLTKNSTCIDILFSSQTKLTNWIWCAFFVISKRHHQIICAKFDLRVFYPPPYVRNVWHFKQANIELIKWAIDNFE